MKSDTVFDYLVHTISDTERRELLERINASDAISEGPLLVRAEPITDLDVEKEYQTAGFFKKLIIFLKTIVTGLSAYEILEESLLKKLLREIAKTYPGLIEMNSRAFLSAMYREIEALRDAVFKVKPIMENTLIAHKKDFVAFLWGRELPLVQEKLLQETDPYGIEGKESKKTDKEIKEELKFKMEDVFMDISSQEKNQIYSQAGSIQQFHRLCHFPFDAILKSFSTDAEGSPLKCYFTEIEEEMIDLSDILYTMNNPPDTRAGEAIIIFAKRERIGDEGFELEKEIKTGLNMLDRAFTQIRQFNATVPLFTIMKYITKDIHYVPRELTGGEDWFAVYKNFWMDRMEKQFARFVKERKKSRIMEEAMRFNHVTELQELDYYARKRFAGKAIPVHELSVSFLRRFFKNILLPEMGRVLKLILLEGDFYKEQNRQDFHDAYNELMRIDEDIAILEAKMDEPGEYGKVIDGLQREILAAPLKKKRLDSVLHKADMDAERLVSKKDNSLLLLQNVLDGILYGEVGGRYDTLSNRAYIGGRENKKLLKDIEGVVEKLGTARDILNKLKDIEKA